MGESSPPNIFLGELHSAQVVYFQRIFRPKAEGRIDIPVPL